jgi:hypothetical protein
VVTQGEGTRGIGYGGAARSMGLLHHHGLFWSTVPFERSMLQLPPAVGACDVNVVQLLMRGGMA